MTFDDYLFSTFSVLWSPVVVIVVLMVITLFTLGAVIASFDIVEGWFLAIVFGVAFVACLLFTISVFRYTFDNGLMWSWS